MNTIKPKDIKKLIFFFLNVKKFSKYTQLDIKIKLKIAFSGGELYNLLIIGME